MAIGLGLAIAGGATLVGSFIQGNAAENAAQTQANAAQNATNAELSMFNTTQGNLAPWLAGGKNALGALDYGLGIGPKTGGVPGMGYGSLVASPQPFNFTQSPGYAWEKQQGIDTVQNSAAAGGGIKGGNTLRALNTFGTGLAQQDYSTAFNQWLQTQNLGLASRAQNINALAGASGQGANAAANLGGFATSVGGQVGSNTIGAGNALAAGQVGVANAASGGLNNLAQLYALYGSGGYGNPGAGGDYNIPAYTSSNFGGNLSGGGGYIIGSGSSSDRRLKTDIKRIGKDANGLPVYQFRYKTSEQRFVGYMADDVLLKFPEAVSVDHDGFMRVTYSRVPNGISLTPIETPRTAFEADGVFA